VTFDDRVAAVKWTGFTDRQTRFLVTVMLHSGVCVERQYCAFARIAHGQNSHDFFARLVAAKWATAYAGAHKRARIFHVHHRALYDAIGEPHSRFRKPTAIGRAVERLMLLDAVLASPDVTWLATERDKLAHFTMLLHRDLRRDELPRLVFGQKGAETVRYFPDKMPIAVASGTDEHVFAYLVMRPAPVDFRAFLQRHAELLRALPRWLVRLIIPMHLQPCAGAYVAAGRQELATPLRPSTADDLRWYFEQRQRMKTATLGLVGDDAARFAQAAQAFGSPRYRVLYRSWLREGAKALNALASPVLADAVSRGRGRIESQVLAHPYLHLSSLVGSS
jgi:hypothetical protein